MKKILIIEDDPTMLQLMNDLLGDSYEITSCVHLDQGLTRIHGGERFDLVLTDFDNPNPAGGALITQAVRQRLPETVVLVASGNPDTAHVRQTCQADAYLEKPWDVMTFIQTVTNSIERGTRAAAA